MVNPLKTLEIKANNFGGELEINWKLPDIKPTSFRVYLFKKNQEITQLEIDNYFNNIEDLSAFNYGGLFVFDKLKAEVVQVSDITVKNDFTYFYKAVVRDEESGERSIAKGVSATPKPFIRVNVKDGKDIVAKAIEKMFDAVYDEKNNKVKLAKDIAIVKQFTIQPITENIVMIERVNGATAQQFWGNSINPQVQGDIDSDIIRATFLTNNPDRRDRVTGIFRAFKPLLLRYCMTHCIQAQITVEGDYYNPQIHGFEWVGVTVIFSLQMQNAFMLQPEEKAEFYITQPIIKEG